MDTPQPIGYIYTERDKKIASLYRSGLLASEIAEIYSLTPGRVHQILRAQGVRGQDGGRAVQRRNRRRFLAQFIQETA